MIELKNVTTAQKAESQMLSNYSLLLKNGSFCRLDKSLGEAVINVILGFQITENGFVCFDGMPLTASSTFFFRKMIAYVPIPEGFEKVSDSSKKQLDMVNEALSSDADIILAVDPTSHQTEGVALNIMNALRKKVTSGKVVIVATDRNDL